MLKVLGCAATSHLEINQKWRVLFIKWYKQVSKAIVYRYKFLFSVFQYDDSIRKIIISEIVYLRIQIHGVHRKDAADDGST